MPEESSSITEALAALHEYFVGDATMSDTLTRICVVVDKIIPAVRFVGLTLLIDGKAGTLRVHPPGGT